MQGKKRNLDKWQVTFRRTAPKQYNKYIFYTLPRIFDTHLGEWKEFLFQILSHGANGLCL